MSLLEELEDFASELIDYKADVPGNTCPDIDKVIDNIKGARTLADSWARANLDTENNYVHEFKELITTADDALWPLPSDLDDLRRSNEQLREAVHEMGSLCHKAGALLRRAANEWPLSDGEQHDQS